MGEGLELIIGGGQCGGGQIRERRQGPVVLAALGIRRLDHAVHHDLNLAVRLFDGEKVGNVAVGVDLLQAAPGRGDAPGQRSLAQVPAWGQMQALHAVLDRPLVAIPCFMSNVHLHRTYASAGGTKKSDAMRSPRSRNLARNCSRNSGKP